MIEEFLPKTPEGRLARLGEESAEVAKEVFKCFRFGSCTITPEGYPMAGTTPRQRLLAELDDLEHAIAAVRKDLA